MRTITLKRFLIVFVTGLLLSAGTSLDAFAQGRGGAGGRGASAGGNPSGGGVRSVGGVRREIILLPGARRGFPVDNFPMPSGRDRRITDIERTRDKDERTHREERERRDERRRRADETRREATRRHDDQANRFQKLGRWIGVSPERLQNFYQEAKATNPDLRLGQFFAAFVIANRLSGSNPSVTPQAILRGQDSGMSLERTLVTLGLSAEEASAAANWAERVVNHLKP